MCFFHILKTIHITYLSFTMASEFKAIGSKEEVFNGLASHTSGGLYKDDLMKSKRGKIVSKRRHEQGKKAFENIKGYCAGEKKDQEESQEPQNIPACANLNNEEPCDYKEEAKLEEPALPLAPSPIPALEEIKSEENNIQDLKEEPIQKEIKIRKKRTPKQK